MRDRVPTPGKEGRIKLIFEDDSSTRYARAELADEAIDKGTDLKKVNLLSDTTEALLNLPDPDEIFLGGESDPTPDDALRALHKESVAAAATARALAFDGNINDEMVRSALGEYTRYKDTYGVGYALFMYGLHNASLSLYLESVCRDDMKLLLNRKQIAQSAVAVRDIGYMTAARDLWRKYAFTIKGKTEETVTTYEYSGVVCNPVNGYLYGWTIPGGNNYGELRVSQDDGATWKTVKRGTTEFTGTSRYYKLAFSSDYKYTYIIDTSRSDDHDRVFYSTDGLTFSETEFRLEAWKIADAHIHDNILMFKAADDRYYYAVRGDNEAAMGRAHVYVCDGKSTGSMVGNTSEDWNGGYAWNDAAYPINNGAVFISSAHPNFEYKGGKEVVYVKVVQYVNGEDKKTIYKTEKDELDADYGSDIKQVEAQMDEGGTIFIKAYVETRSNGSATNYYKITQEGKVSVLNDAQAFPAGQAGNFGLVYKLPQGQSYEPYISSYTGKLVRDNWGPVADGTKVMPVFLTDQRGHTTDGKIMTVYSAAEKTKSVINFNDAEAE